jgi:hypothetical protein
LPVSSDTYMSYEVGMRRILTTAAALALVVACANPSEVVDTPETGAVDASTEAAPKKDSGKDVEVQKDSSGGDATIADATLDGIADASDATLDVVADVASDVVDGSIDASDAAVDASDAAVDASDGGVLDGGTSNDTCSMAVALTSGVNVSGDTTNANDDYDVNVSLSNVCSQTDLSFYQFDGNDVAYSIVVPNGKTLTATVTPTTLWDPALSIVGDCSNIGPTCLGGDDFNGAGSAETGTYTNSSGQAKTVFVVVDSYDFSEYGPFTLSVLVQ